MTKREVQQRVLQGGRPLSLDKFEWNEKAKVFSTIESDLVLDFNNVNNVMFKTGWNCTFKTDWDCTFNTGADCTFKTGSVCTFNTGEECVVIRRDVYEIIKLDGSKEIKLNKYRIKGFYEIKDTHTIFINDKEIELSEESYQNLKDQLFN